MTGTEEIELVDSRLPEEPSMKLSYSSRNCIQGARSEVTSRRLLVFILAFNVIMCDNLAETRHNTSFNPLHLRRLVHIVDRIWRFVVRGWDLCSSVTSSEFSSGRDPLS